ncbi:MAG: uroporphyrinogen decarboxylase family protein [Anaerolineae bacterium]
MTLGSLEICQKYGLDLAFVDYDVYNIEAEALGQTMIWHDDGTPDTDPTRPMITDPQDLPKIKTPDFENDGRFPTIMAANKLYRRETGLEPVLQFCAPFSLAVNIRGFENLVTDMVMEPAFARHLFDRIIEEVLAPWILYQKNYFPQAMSVSGSDAAASVPLLNVPMLREWVVPGIQRLRELCGPEISVPNWIGERILRNPEDLLDLKLAVTKTFIEGQDPDVEKLGPAYYKAYAQKHDVPLVLGVGAEFLALAAPAEIEQRVKYYVEVGGENGRFALYLCNIGSNPPVENLKAAITAVKTYGVYK